MTTQNHIIRVNEVGHIPGADMLGPFPILQFFAALIVLVVVAVGGFVWVKGQKIHEPLSAPRALEAAIQLFFDGPLKAIFEYLQEIRQRVIGNKLEFRDEMATLLSDQRKAIVSELNSTRTDLQREIDNALGSIDEKLKDMNDLLVRADERDKRHRT